MDNYNIQTLISEGRIIGVGDVNPNDSYVSVGVYQKGNRKSGAANNAYPSYAISLSDLGGPVSQIIDAAGTSLYSVYPPAGPGFSTSEGIFFGQNAGYNSPNSNTSVFIGTHSGYNASNAGASVFIGRYAGYNTSNNGDCNIIGDFAGGGSSNNYATTMIGTSAGQNTTGCYYSTIIGLQAGQNMFNSYRTTAIGTLAGWQNTNCVNSVLIGEQASAETSNSPALVSIGSLAGWGGRRPFNYYGDINRTTYGNDSAVFLGDSAGIGADQAQFAVAIGFQAGAGVGGEAVKVGGGTRNVYIGMQSGVFNKRSSYTHIIGYFAGVYSDRLLHVSALGTYSGFGSSANTQCAYIGYNAGSSSYNMLNSYFIGTNAGVSSSGSDVIALGTSAGTGNTVSNCFIISNNHIKDFVNQAAATAYFSAAPAGNTYLYWDSTNNKLEAIRK